MRGPRTGGDRNLFAAAPRLADPGFLGLGQIRHHLPVYVFSGTEDPVGQQLAEVSVLIGRYRAADVSNISHDFYPGGRHEMLNEVNREEVRSNLLRWISEVLSGSGCRVEQGGNQAA